MTLSRRAAALTCLLIACGWTHLAHAQAANSDPVAAASFHYAVACESREEFLSRLAELSGDPDVERALARRNVDVSISQLDPEQWTLTVQRTTDSGTQGRVLREKSCEQLATAARVVLSVWLREESELPPSPPPPPAAAPPPPPPIAAEPNAAAEEVLPVASDDPYHRRFFGASALVEISSNYFVASGAAVTGELWTMLEKLRLSVALSYWTSLREWMGETPDVRVRGWDATAHGSFFLYQASDLDLGLMAALSVGFARSQAVGLRLNERREHLYLRPTAGGILLWSFARPFRLRAIAGITAFDPFSGSIDDQRPSLYAAAGLDFTF